MSLYKDASLVMIPSAYKDGKLYSIRPTDGSGDFTFSRGSNLAATRVDVNGIIEKGRENLLTYSNQFDTTWTIFDSTLASGQADKDGGTSAWKFTNNNPYGRVTQDVTSSGVNTFSIYAKQGNNPYLRMQFQPVGHDAYFDLSDGSVISTEATIIDAGTEDVGNGWYRVFASVNQTIDNVRIVHTGAGGAGGGSIGDYFYIQDAQLEAGLVATDYIETGASTAQAGILEDMPRLDYSGSCPSLLLEPQRSNLITFSEHLESSYYGNTRCTIDDNSTTSPEGVINASKMTSTDASESYIQGNVTTTGTKMSWSFFAKKGDLDYCHGLIWSSPNGCRQWFNLSTGAVGGTTTFGTGYSVDSASIEDYGNGWYRCTMIVNCSAGTQGCRVNISSADTAIGSAVNSYGYFYGLQAEDASYPTSYIPTYGSSVTRSADYMQVTPTDLLGGDIGTWYLELDDWSFEITGTQVPTIYLGDDTQNCLALEAKTLNNIKNIHLVQEENNTSTTLYSFTLSGKTKICFVWDGTTLKIFKDGSSVYSATNFTQPTNWDEFVYNHGSREAMMRIPNINLFPTALTDSECIALTTI